MEKIQSNPIQSNPIKFNPIEYKLLLGINLLLEKELKKLDLDQTKYWVSNHDIGLYFRPSFYDDQSEDTKNNILRLVKKYYGSDFIEKDIWDGYKDFGRQDRFKVNIEITEEIQDELDGLSNEEKMMIDKIVKNKIEDEKRYEKMMDSKFKYSDCNKSRYSKERKDSESSLGLE